MDKSSSLTLAQKQAVTFEILKKTTEICDRNGIRYFLAYGTLLGAVRHADFIPWDDDVDVWMPREDYDNFRKLTLPDTLHFLKEEDNQSVWNFTKLCLTDTYFDETNIKVKLSDEYGIFVDVFPLDNVSNNLMVAQLNYWFIKKIEGYYKNLAIAYTTKSKKWYANVARTIVRHNSPLRTFLARTLKRMIKRMRLRYSHSDTECFGVAIAEKFTQTRYKKTDFLQGERAKFRDCEFTIPGDYNTVLTAEYGKDWRTPIQREIPTHGNAYILAGSLGELIERIRNS